MPSLTRAIETDVCVVGAGLTGLAHAHEARRRGLSVVVLERGTGLTGASVRHSGHLFFSGVAGAPPARLEFARERWLELTQRAGITAAGGGTLIVARHPDELALMEAVAAEPARRARVRSAKKVGRLAPIPLAGVLGAYHAKHDLRIGPRSGAVALARLLSRDPRARIEWGVPAHEVEPGTVHAGALRVRAQAIVVCTGADRRAMPHGLWPADRALALRRAQMLRLASPAGRRYPAALATGLSLLGYPAFATGELSDQLRRRLELETPELVEREVSPLLTQLAEGDLIVGSTTTYTDAPSPFGRERADELLLDQVRELLGFVPVVRQRWRMTTLAAAHVADDFLTTKPMPGVRVVQPVRATSLAMCHAHAATVLDHLLAEPRSANMYITVRDARRDATRGGVREHARLFGSGSNTTG